MAGGLILWKRTHRGSRSDFGETNPIGKSATLSNVGICEYGTDAAVAAGMLPQAAERIGGSGAKRPASALAHCSA
jgi:hypothetical protein